MHICCLSDVVWEELVGARLPSSTSPPVIRGHHCHTYLLCKDVPAAPFLLFPPFSLSPLFHLTLRVGSFGAPPASEMRRRQRRKENIEVSETEKRKRTKDQNEEKERKSWGGGQGKKGRGRGMGSGGWRSMGTEEGRTSY